jgi:predicted metal-dependent peptidase
MTSSATPQITIEKALSKAKIAMMMLPDTVFFSTLCTSLEVVITDEVPTAGTDGRKLYINKDFFFGLTEGERVFLLAHETLHVAYLHPLRGQGKDQEIFNDACDYVINYELKQRKFSFIEGVLYDPQYAGMSAEEVYEKLIQNPNYKPKCAMPDLLSPNGKPNSPVLTEEQVKAIEQEVMAKVTQAAMMAEMSKQSGSIPSHIKRTLEELSKPKVNWKAVLSRFFSDMNRANYSWSKPNRKYLPMYLPKLHSTNLGRVDFAIDTSGSITADQFNQFVSEVHGVLKMLNPTEIGVYQFDHALQGSNIVRSVRDIIKLPFKGGGGTSPQCAIEEFIKNKAQALIVLTDGYFNGNRLTDPKRPVVWVIYDNESFIPPFGKAVHIKFT